MSDAADLRSLAAWIRRRFGGVLADLEAVDCGSLDVLLYCADDLVVPPGEMEVDQRR